MLGYKAITDPGHLDAAVRWADEGYSRGKLFNALAAQLPECKRCHDQASLLHPLAKFEWDVYWHPMGWLHLHGPYPWEAES